MGGFLIFVSFIVFVWACVGLIRPASARIPNRLISPLIWLGSLWLFMQGISLMPDKPPPAPVPVRALVNNSDGTRSAAAPRPSQNQWTPASRELFAAVQCPDHIERLAQYGVRWTDGMLEPKFPRSGWSDEANYLAVYMGDAIEFQNGFGAWERHRYSCVVDVKNEQVIDVAALPGRLE